MTPDVPSELPSVEDVDHLSRVLDELGSEGSCPSTLPFDGLDDVFYLLQASVRDADARRPASVDERIWARVLASLPE